MTKLKNLTDGRRALLLACLMAIVLAIGLGAMQSRSWAEGGNWKNVTLVYSTDIKGKIEPCG